MKQLLINTIYQIERDLDSMSKTDMKLSERIKYEKSKVRLEVLKELIYKLEIKANP